MVGDVVGVQNRWKEGNPGVGRSFDICAKGFFEESGEPLRLSNCLVMVWGGEPMVDTKSLG